MIGAGPVLWLLSGGSAISLEVETARRLTGQSALERLTVSLIDERYGPPGHPESNWQKLIEAGFDLPNAQMAPVLAGKDSVETLEEYRSLLDAKLRGEAYVIGVLGIGADGHTAGILPASPAVASDDLALTYQAEEFNRITITCMGLEALDEAVVYAYGEPKHAVIRQLAERNLSPAEQPAQIIKKIPRWSVFNDLIGEEL